MYLKCINYCVKYVFLHFLFGFSAFHFLLVQELISLGVRNSLQGVQMGALLKYRDEKTDIACLKSDRRKIPEKDWSFCGRGGELLQHAFF